MDAINSVLDCKLDQLAARLENMMSEDLRATEKVQKNVQGEVKKLKEDVDNGINHVEFVLKRDIDYAWEYPVKNEQYFR